MDLIRATKRSNKKKRSLWASEPPPLAPKPGFPGKAKGFRRLTRHTCSVESHFGSRNLPGVSTLIGALKPWRVSGKKHVSPFNNVFCCTCESPPTRFALLFGVANSSDLLPQLADLAKKAHPNRKHQKNVRTNTPRNCIMPFHRVSLEFTVASSGLAPVSSFRPMKRAR